MIRKNITLQNSTGENFSVDFRYDDGTRDAATILVLHGFKGFKDWGFFPDLGRALAGDGYATICINFSRNGIGLDPKNFTELDRFAENSYSQELADVKTIVEAVKSEKIGKRLINPDCLGILGHSRGGAVALLAALENEDTFQAVVTWASVANLYRYNDDQINAWKNKGFIEMENARTKQMMRMNRSFWDDLDQNRDRFNILERIEDLEIPSLFIHGSNDSSVSYEESESLHESCGASIKRLEVIEGAGHTFGIKHPFESKTTEYETALDLSENWFDNNMDI